MRCWLGVWCGLATLARSELALSFVLVLLPLLLLTKERPWKVRVGWLAAAGVIGIAVVSPWLIFNAGRFHHPVFISTSAGRTMAASNCDTTYTGPRLGFKSYHCLETAVRPYYTKHDDETDRDRKLRADSIQYMKDHADRVPIVIAARWGRLLQIYQPRQEITLNGYYHVQGRFATEVQFWMFYPVAVLAIVGVFVLRKRRVVIFPLLVFPAMTLIAVATTFAQWRYRAAAEPALVLLAAVAIAGGVVPDPAFKRCAEGPQEGARWPRSGGRPPEIFGQPQEGARASVELHGRVAHQLLPAVRRLDLADRPGLRAHHQALGAGPVAPVADALEQVAVADARRREEHLVTGYEVVGGEDALEVVAPARPRPCAPRRCGR